MTLIVLAMTGLLACAFHVTSYVNGCETREARGQLVPQIDEPSDGAQTDKRPYLMGSRKNAERHDSLDVSSYRATRMTGLSRRRGLGWNKSERIAGQKIATSLSLRKRR